MQPTPTSIAATLAAALVLGPWAAANGADFAVSIPSPGADLSAPAGATLGWGYRIENLSALWLELTSLDADPFSEGTATSLFDFPILAPGEVRTLAYDGIGGLFELTWDPAAPAGFVNVGSFVLTGAFWDGDPLSGGTPSTEPAATQGVAYSATVAGVPLPATLLLTLAGFASLAATRRTSRSA